MHTVNYSYKTISYQLVAFFFILTTSLFAAPDDSTSIAKVKSKFTNNSFNARLYNYTNPSLNYIFNEDFREGATWRSTIAFDYSNNSTSVPASLGFDLIFKKNIPRTLINRVDGRIKNGLQFEDYMKTGYTLRHYVKKLDCTFYFSFNHRQSRELNAGKQAFELIFYGNARFAGDTADLSNLRFYNYLFNQYEIGIKKKFDYGTYQMDFGLGISLLQVFSQQEIRTGKTFVYTATDGDTLGISYDLTFNSSNEGATKFGDRNGLGASGDFHLGFMNKDKWKLTFDISDLGYTTYRKNPVNYSGVKSVDFSGFILPDLTTFSSQTFDTLKLDSAIRSYLPVKSNNIYSLFMPFTFAVMFSKPLLHDKLVLTAGLQYKYLPKYYVYGFLKANYFIQRDLVVSVSAGAGGYSKFNLGIELSKSWKHFDLAFGTPNLIGLCAPSHYYGTGFYLRLGSSY